MDTERYKDRKIERDGEKSLAVVRSDDDDNDGSNDDDNNDDDGKSEGKWARCSGFIFSNPSRSHVSLRKINKDKYYDGCGRTALGRHTESPTNERP